MSQVWLNSFIGVLVTSLISLVGILVLVISKRELKLVISILVALAGGVMLGDVFIHIVPEVASEFGFGLEISLYFLIGMLFFYVLEEFLAWRHCHDVDCSEHPKKLALIIFQVFSTGPEKSTSILSRTPKIISALAQEILIIPLARVLMQLSLKLRPWVNMLLTLLLAIKILIRMNFTLISKMISVCRPRLK